jgi:glyoxylase-like metal-dependent hydrolase (beta-lactamase superfamily II)
VPVSPHVEAFFDEPTSNATYVVSDPGSKACAVIDSVADFDPASACIGSAAADRVAAHIDAHGLGVAWILETHVHADHLTAAPYLKRRLGGRIGIGACIAEVQRGFRDIFDMEPGFAADGSQFDRLFADGDEFAIGGLTARVLHTPGHTPACVTYLIGDAAFVGDTLFMPDSGTARADFPGGDARTLYRSIRRILSLPRETRIFVCHDYGADGERAVAWETTVAAQRASNKHVRDGIDEEAFVRMREARDATLGMPRLIMPAIQINMRAGELPPQAANGRRYLKIPLGGF